MKKLIINYENPNGVLVDMSAEEIAQREQDNQDFLAQKQIAQAEATNKVNGNQKLLDLGLTQAEATALTGYTPPTEV